MTGPAHDGGGDWVAGRLARSVGRRIRDGWRGLPDSGRRRWLGTLGGGVLAILALMVAVEWAGRRLADGGMLAFEADILRWLEDEGPVSFSTAVWIQTLGTDITLVMLVAFTAGIAAWAGRTLRSLTIVASILLLDPVIRIGWMLWNRPRPDLIMDGLAAPGFASFPSGHTAKAVALYGLLTYIWASASRSAVERATALLVLTVIIALVIFGRLRMGVHWPSDAVAGLLMGLAWLAVLVFALRRAGDGDPNRG